MESFANIKELSAYFGNPWFQSLGIVIVSLVCLVFLFHFRSALVAIFMLPVPCWVLVC